MILLALVLSLNLATTADSAALALIDQGRLDEAIDALHLARARRPDDTSLMFLMARTLRQAGRSGLAESLAETIIRRDSTHRPARVLFASLLAEREHWTGARVAYQDLVAADSTNPLFRYQLATVYLQMDLLPAALAELRAARAFGPRNLVILQDLIRTEVLLDSLDAAEAHAAQAIELAPDHLPFRKRAGEIAFRRKRYAEAVDQYAYAADLGDRSAPTLRNWGMSLHFAERDTQAVRVLLESAHLKPDDAHTRFYLAMALFRIGRPEDALPHLDAAIDASKGMLLVDGYIQKGVILDQQARTDAAVANYAVALSLDPARTDILYFTAAAIDRAGTRKRQARDAFQRYLDAPGEKDPHLANYARRRVSVLTEEIHFRGD
jgi:tetratricopeptide (TPR) repeat protein